MLAADRLKNQFISHVSYELRTPLQKRDRLQRTAGEPAHRRPQPQQRDYLGDILAQSHSLQSIVDDILDLATIDAGALELKLAPVKVDAVIDRAVR